VPGDVVTFANGATAPYNATTSATATGLTIRRGPTVITITWDRTATATLTTSTRTYFRDGRRRVHVLRIPHGGQLRTTIAIA
jgi:hypothetical protein